MGYTDSYYTRNRDRILAKQARYDQAHPLRKREQHLKSRYGLDLKAYDALLEAQGGCCAICRCSKPGGRGTWHVDHDHKTDKVRGLLCHDCNTGLGKFKDDPEILKLAIVYLGVARG